MQIKWNFRVFCFDEFFFWLVYSFTIYLFCNFYSDASRTGHSDIESGLFSILFSSNRICCWYIYLFGNVNENAKEFPLLNFRLNVHSQFIWCLIVYCKSRNWNCSFIILQTFLVWQLAFTTVLLGKRYSFNQIAGCLLVAVGVVVAVTRYAISSILFQIILALGVLTFQSRVV